MPDPNSNNDSVSAAGIDVAVYLEARNQEHLYDSLPTICYIGFLSVMGLVGNSVVFMVYYKRYHASCTIRYYVLVMSVTDMLTNAQILPAEVLEMRFYATFRWSWACRIFRLTRSFLVILSSLLLVAVAVNRKQAVCKLQVVPMHASYKRLNFPVGSCLVWALLLSLPNGIITGYRTQEFADNLNITGVTCTISDDFAGTQIPLIYNLVLFLTFLILVCIMGVSYGRILLHLRRHRKKLERWQVKAEANAKQPKKNDVATIPNDVATIPNDVATILNDVATIPNDVATTPNQSATALNEVATNSNESATTTNDVSTTPNEVATTPNEVATTPNDVATTTNDVATTLNESATTHNEVATTQNKVATTTNEVATTQNEVATTTNEVATTQNEVATTTNEVATTQNEVATTTNEVVTKPNKVESKPNEVATKVKAKLRSKIEQGQTMMFGVLTLVFVVSNLPHLTVVILKALRPGLAETTLTTILVRSFYINSAVNPIVYSFCSPKFRFECRQFFACCPLVGSFLAIRD